MPYTYPPAAPTISGDNVTISPVPQQPDPGRPPAADLLEQRYIADTLLSGRFDRSPVARSPTRPASRSSRARTRAPSPGHGVPAGLPATGTASIAKTVKWGQDALITDESIKRRQMDPVNRALTKLANQNVKYVDSVALAAIASAVTATANAAADWSTATAAQILRTWRSRRRTSSP
jgi:hypothetical protein